MVVFFIHQLGTCLVLSLQMDFFSTNPLSAITHLTRRGGGDVPLFFKITPRVGWVMVFADHFD